MKIAVAVNIVAPPGNIPLLEEYHRQCEELSSEDKYSFNLYLNDKGTEGLATIRERSHAEGYDSLLVMDSDMVLENGVLSDLMENSEFLRHKAIIAGSVTGADGSIVSGGRNHRGRLVTPDPTIPIPCSLFDLSFVLVPAYAFNSLHNPDEMFHKNIWDRGYGEKAASAGVARVVAPGIVARTSRDIELPVWKNMEVPVHKRIWAFIKNQLHI